ncbi:transposase IS4 family protein [Acidimicrobium ferrooxidans DSM 10331]|uniref:Transposase IS4 family protein n=1 Tax=Acidimicrobium ferrooxidans (strain DSM 10331 / JCM 15462 / NBRC 103882 / ICP) TaxID=525909 RepID=C7M1A8_ACIFD|nr:IS1182-like element ISAcfe2 family transposase [Acidimicrobium ferrooxidans]ACU54756.1 transposase IS4 family protein [Acidimicrobium ferrooxidans DSM 10331]
MLGTESDQAHLTATEAFCSSLIEPGSIYAFLAEHRRELFPDERFRHLYPSTTGRPSIPASRVLAVMVLQVLEGLSDTEATEQVRYNLRWKYALGLDLEDPGFHPTVLTYWRRRIATSETPRLIGELVAEVIGATGVLKGKTKRVVDSTVLADAVATQDTMTQLVAQINRVRRLIPELREIPLSPAIDYTRAKPAIDYRDEEAVVRTVSALVADATAHLAHAEKLASLTEPQTEALGLLGLVAGQDVECVDAKEGRWRIARRVATDRVISTVDPDARHVHKSRARAIDGYKGHVAVEPDSGIVTAATITKGTVPDAAVASELLRDEDGPRTVYGDSAYATSEVSNELAARGHDEVIKPRPLAMAVPGGFTIDDFVVEEGWVSCPQGHRVPISAKGRASFVKHCTGCPLRDRCTRSKRGRVLTFTPATWHAISQRAHFGDPAVRLDYQRTRPNVERIHAQLKRKLSGARLRYLGLVRNRLHFELLCATWNLKVLLRLGLTRVGGGWVLAT